MADITYTNTATQRSESQGLVPGQGEANNLKYLSAVVELAPSSSGDTVKFMRIPSNARIAHLSRIYWDDLTTANSPTFDVGLASVNANITSDPDALSAGHVITAADLTGEPLLDLFEKSGDRAWEFVNGVTEDPLGEFDVFGTLVDADTVGLTGTIMVELAIFFD